MMTAIRIIGFTILYLSAVDSAKILVMILPEARSHFNVFFPMIEALSRRQHSVTVQTFHDFKLPNVKVLLLNQAKHQVDPKNRMTILLNNIKNGPISQMLDRKDRFKGLWELYMNEWTTRALIADGKQYDLVIVDALYAEFMIAIASSLGEHVVEVNTACLYPYRTGSLPAPPSYVPNTFEFMTSSMSFWERMQNSLNTLGLYFLAGYQMVREQQDLLDEHFPNMPPIQEAVRKVALTITNSDPVMDLPRPQITNVVHCGGMHCSDPKPLPKDLQNFVDSSGEDGFIVFGLGSNIHSDFIPPEFHQSVLSAFSRLKQKVIWKFDSNVEDLPPNVKIVKWMPQQDLLGHPKARLFITHAGLLSLQETIYHGVPVIGIPFFADQPGNIARVQQLGIGQHLNFFDLTGDKLYQQISDMLQNKSYVDNMKKYSRIMKDQLNKPIDRAVFWIEYVIRHNGAPHFRSAAEELSFVQYFLIDVVLFVTLILIISLCTCVRWRKSRLEQSQPKTKYQ